MTNDGNEMRRDGIDRDAGSPAAAAAAARMRRPLPVKTRSGVAVAGLTLALTAIGAVGLPFAEYADARAPQALDAGRFELYLGGVPVGAVRFQVRIDGRDASVAHIGDHYRAEAIGDPSKAMRTLLGARLKAEGEGVVASVPRPIAFQLDAALAGTPIKLDVDYDGAGAPARVIAEPAFKPRPWALDPTAQAGTTDPMGAAVMFLAPGSPETLCNRTADIFDGRRRTRVTFEAPQANAAGGWRCEGTWSRVAGYKAKDLAKPAVPVSVEFEPWADGLARVARLEADTGYGRAVAMRVTPKI